MINPETKYPGKITPSSTSYPYGKARNIIIAGDGLGTPWDEALLNDMFALQQSLVTAAGIVPSTVSDTVLLSQQMQALTEIISGRAINYDDSGAADAYVLSVKTNQHPPKSYFHGMIIRFLGSVVNTGGAVTVNVEGIGVVSIVEAGAAPIAGKISTTEDNTCVYDLPNARFNLLLKDSEIALNTAHRTGDGSDHADVAANTAAIALNTAHRTGDGSDHADVAANTAAIASLGSPVSGNFTTISLGFDAEDSGNVTHGLGTDDIIVEIQANGSIEESWVVGVNTLKGGISFNLNGGSTVSVPPVPATGKFEWIVKNRSASSQTITVYWTVRKR